MIPYFTKNARLYHRQKLSKTFPTFRRLHINYYDIHVENDTIFHQKCTFVSQAKAIKNFPDVSPTEHTKLKAMTNKNNCSWIQREGNPSCSCWNFRNNTATLVLVFALLLRVTDDALQCQVIHSFVEPRELKGRKVNRKSRYATKTARLGTRYVNGIPAYILSFTCGSVCGSTKTEKYELIHLSQTNNWEHWCIISTIGASRWHFTNLTLLALYQN
jgi:hypothetical protein